MGRKKSNSSNAATLLESRVSPILEIKYSDPLFTVAAHPSRPVLLLGLVTGHVYCHTYNAERLEEQQSSMREKIATMEKEAFAKGKIGQINKSVSQLNSKWWTQIEDHSQIEDENVVVNWKTKRHKGSCRHAIFDPLELSLGENVYTVGTDHWIKKANTETGRVVGKTSMEEHLGKKDSVTKMCHSTSHPFLLTGTEDGHVLVYDSANLGKNQLKFKVELVHDDAINHLMAMPSVSAYHYLSLGSTTLSHIDIRKGIITQSDNQDDELLSMCYASDQITENKNDTVLVGHGVGIVTIWKNSKNRFMDQLSRIKVNTHASIDAIMPTMNVDNDDQAASVWCGDSDGLLHRVNYKKGRVVETRVHSSAVGKYGAADEVGILDVDYDYRLISAGMETLKIWSGQEYEEDQESDSESSGDDSDSELDIGSESDSGIEFLSDEEKDEEDKKPDGEEVEEDEEENEVVEDGEESDEESESEVETKPKLVRRPYPRTQQKKTKKVNLNSEPAATEPEPPVKKQKKQMSTKQLKNLQKHEHGIRRFDGL